ncbi:hypothetical protein QZH41_008857, partial [Actinostola sp. cb2023]
MFPLFMKNFEINVESKEDHDSDRLSYLIQFCKGKAKEAIEHCIIMPPEEGYKRAKDILRNNFGRTHIVSKAFLDKVVKGPPIRIAESEKLAQLSRDMESCMLGSSQLDMESNLNSLDTLGKVVGRLPISMKAKWAEKANQLYDKGVTPKFSHLANFVEERSAVANTYFGQLISEGKNEFQRDMKQKSSYLKATSTPRQSYVNPTAKATTLATSSSDKAQFKQQSQRDQADTSDDQATQHGPSIPTPAVKGSTTTSSPSAAWSKQTKDTAHCSALQTDLRRVSLKVVPVKVTARDSKRVIETYAFLDDGSDTTMCLRSLAEDLGVEGKPVEFVLSTMIGNQQRSGQQLSLDIVGIATGKGLRLEKVWTTDRLPITEECILTKNELSSWPHLKDVNMAEIPNKEITILIGSDAPEALCPLEVKSGKKREPYALRTLLGWTVTGPLKGRTTRRAEVNYLHVDQVLGCDEPESVLTPIETQLERLCNSEFTESTAEIRECMSLEDRRPKAIMDNTVTFVNGHYQIGLPWKYDAPQLPNNRPMAERRLELLKKRLLRDPVLAKKYTETMEQYIAKGHAAKVQEDSNWPPLPDDMPEIADGDVEVKKCVSQVPVQVNVMSSDAKTTSLSDILHRSSSWYRLCKLIAWLVRFKTYCRSRYGKGKRIEVSKDPLSVKDISEAEDDIVRLVQREAFCLKKEESLKNLSPILEEGILRVGGRLVNAPEETLKHPAILPSKHHVTNLIVSHYHKGNGHVGANQTLSAIRQKYWIIKGPSTVRRIMNTCLPCRRQNQLLDEETLLTTLCEVERIINDRPLTPLSNDPKDMEVLTPSSLLLLRQNHSVPPCDVGDSIKLKERWKLAQQLADSFWKRWISEYLPTLQEKQKWLRRQRNMSVGDLVLIRDDNIQR